MCRSAATKPAASGVRTAMQGSINTPSSNPSPTPLPEGATEMDAYDPFSEAVREDPYPYYAVLRDEAPVYWAEAAQTWCVSRYDDVQLVLRNPELFSSDA